MEWQERTVLPCKHEQEEYGGALHHLLHAHSNQFHFFEDDDAAER